MRTATRAGPGGLAVFCLLVISLWGIAEAQPFLIPISIAALLAFTMSPFVRVLRRLHFPEWSAIIISAILLVLPFLSLLYVLIWQGQALVKDFPFLTETINRSIINLVKSELGQKLHLAKDLDVHVLVRRLEVSATQGIQFVITGFGALLGAGSQLALILLFAVLMLASRGHLQRCSEKILRETLSVENPQILEDVIALVEKFLIARLLIVLIVGGIDTTILVFFNIEYAFLLGCFLGVMTLIPAVGFILAVAPPIIVSFAMNKSILVTLTMTGALFVISIIEGNVLTPKMVGKRLNINALFTFIGLFGGGLLWGIWGMFLSIPVMGVIRILCNAAPSLKPWGELLAEKDETLLKVQPPPKNTDRVA
jgi:predicted PurR-regulated permease PerM